MIQQAKEAGRQRPCRKGVGAVWIPSQLYYMSENNKQYQTETKINNQQHEKNISEKSIKHKAIFHKNINILMPQIYMLNLQEVNFCFGATKKKHPLRGTKNNCRKGAILRTNQFQVK